MRTTSIRDHTDSTKTKLLDQWTGANDLQSDMRKRSRGIQISKPTFCLFAKSMKSIMSEAASSKVDAVNRENVVCIFGLTGCDLEPSVLVFFFAVFFLSACSSEFFFGDVVSRSHSCLPSNTLNHVSILFVIYLVGSCWCILESKLCYLFQRAELCKANRRGDSQVGSGARRGTKP